VTPEQQLLDRIRRALADAGLDADDLVEEAYEQARTEVAGVLRRMMVQDLLGRALRSLGGDPPAEGPRPPSPPRAAEGPQPRSDDPAPAADGKPDAESPGSRPAQVLTYVFGITPADAPGDVLDAEELTPLPGGGELRTLQTDGLSALVCDVDPATFEVLRTPGPEGLDTLTAAALAHDATLAALARGTTVLPLKLGTVVPDDDALLDLLRDHREQLVGELGRLAGHAEWSVTVQVFEDDDRHGEDAARTASSGSEYLQRRSASLGQRASRFERRERLARHLHERLAGVAVASDTVSTRPVKDVAPPLLHGVYLVADGAVGELEAVVAALREEHPEAVIEIGGPWPPYHFSAVELAVPPGAGS
jgi:hypothetical protein